MKFILRIDLGNEAMREPLDVADALREVQEKLATTKGTPLRVNEGGYIRDRNGNSVGEWRVS